MVSNLERFSILLVYHIFNPSPETPYYKAVRGMEIIELPKLLPKGPSIEWPPKRTANIGKEEGWDKYLWNKKVIIGIIVASILVGYLVWANWENIPIGKHSKGQSAKEANKFDSLNDGEYNNENDLEYEKEHSMEETLEGF